MTKAEARLKIALHAGRNDNFSEGYIYALRYGFKNLPELQQKFEEIFVYLKELKESFYSPEIERELLADLNEILYESILYISNKKLDYCVVQIFAEILSETLVYLLENAEYPFEAFDSYKENYDDILNREIKQ
ncbi:hypothetical protein [Clostridium amazonitimonense]|uniref:hypothetical protein n=1 Tax=Clostridium amazonitimonense TaxID=1499689 RepID=UPI0005098FFB|nr:hypothetical protein [Clostridium amazonitimonense]